MGDFLEKIQLTKIDTRLGICQFSAWWLPGPLGQVFPRLPSLAPGCPVINQRQSPRDLGELPPVVVKRHSGRASVWDNIFVKIQK